MKARKHLLTHVFASLAALPLAVPPAYAAALPRVGQPVQTVGVAVTDRNGHQDDLHVAQATEPPADENDPEWKKKHQEGGEKPPAATQKPEQPKPEPPKAEPPKPEPPKVEPPKPEPPKAEPPKQEAPAPKAEAPKPAAPKVEAPKAEVPKPEAPKAAAPAAAEPKPEAKRPAEPEAQPKPPAEKAPVEKPAPEAPKPAEPKPTEAKPAEKPAAEAPKPAAEPKATEKPTLEAPKPETPEAPKPAPQKGEVPKPGEPKPQTPKAPSNAKPPADAAPSEKPAPEAAKPAPAGQAPAALQAPVLDSAKQAPAPDSAKEAPASDSAKSPPTAAAPANQPAAVAPPPADGQRRVAPGAGERHAPPKSDADAQGPAAKVAPPPPIAPADRHEGRRLDGRPHFDAPRDARVEGRVDGRDILNILGQVIVRGGDADRFSRDGGQTYYDELPGGRTRETIERPNGVSVVTIRNRYGDVIQRSRIGRDGHETVLFYAPELERRPDREQVFRDPSLDLPPMQLDIPVDDYIIDTSNARNPDYYDFLREPPVEHVERVYSLDEVRYSARVRDKMRRVDLDTIHFATGSADVSMNEATSLKQVAEAMKRIIDRNPGETFLIEGHTDAVGSDQANLVLSDRRAESVAIALTDLFGIPPENLVTQGYGERYLKVRTDGPSQENRRVTIRRITPLVRPVASSR